MNLPVVTTKSLGRLTIFRCWNDSSWDSGFDGFIGFL